MRRHPHHATPAGTLIPKCAGESIPSFDGAVTEAMAAWRRCTPGGGRVAIGEANDQVGNGRANDRRPRNEGAGTSRVDANSANRHVVAGWRVGRAQDTLRVQPPAPRHMTTAPGHAESLEPGRFALAAFAPLRPAEQVLLRAFLDGDIARVGLRRPLLPSASITVRGEFVAYLARGGPEGRFPPRRVQIVGAWIDGGVDLRNASVPEAFWFYRCVFNATPRLDGARVGGSVSFPGCLLPGLRAEDCSFAGNLALNSGCTVRTEVRLARARIGRDLNLERLHLRSAEHSDMPIQRRLSAEGARIDGHAIMQGGFESDGDLYLVGLRLVGDLRASGARLSGGIDRDGQRGDALNLDHARIAGSVVFDHGFSATGLVRRNSRASRATSSAAGPPSMHSANWPGATPPRWRSIVRASAARYR